MKTSSTMPTRISASSASFFGAAMLGAALLLPASGFSQPLAPVDLLSTANFAILAGAGITNVPPSVITGDVGASPIAGSAITGLNQDEVSGTIYTVNDAGPANRVMDPTRLTAAQNDLTTAFNEAAGRTPVPTGDYLNPGAGNMGGMNLAPGLYKFTSAALISGADLTLTGKANDVWIFQIGTKLTVEKDIHVVLNGGAKAANIFWQVGSSATLGVNAVMQGTILADQSITLASGATLNGRALARIASVTLNQNTVTRSSLSLSPTSETFLPAQPQVNLLSAGNFVILSGAGITNVPTSVITGDVGSSPIGGTAITGFGLTEITGAIYTTNDAGPANRVMDPTRLTAAQNDLTTAFNEAAGRTPEPTGEYLNPGDSNMGGLNLGPGLYKFTSAASISGSDLTLTGSASDVWVFQIASKLTVANGISVVLAGGAKASNIYWQVGTSATIGTDCVMQGNILADQSITLATHATLNGRALARVASVTLQMNTITMPGLELTPNATPVEGATWGTMKRSSH